MTVKCPKCGENITKKRRKRKKTPQKLPTRRQMLAWVYYYIYNMSQRDAAERMGICQKSLWQLLQGFDRIWPDMQINGKYIRTTFSFEENADSEPKERF